MAITGEVAKIEINGWPVHYEKFGIGPEILLLIPGAIGTGRTDFGPQIEGPHSFDLEKYTLICIELPGWGRSRPPQRKFDPNVYLNDAFCAMKIMDSLGFKSYSIIGWSDGAKVALIISYKAPEKVKCVVVISVFMKMNFETVNPILGTSDISEWPQELRDNYEKAYSYDDIQKLWEEYIDYCKVCVNFFPGGLWTNELHNIICPVLLFHGDLDPIVGVEQAVYAEKHIPCTRLHRFPKGTHNCHQKFANEFKRISEHFFRNSAQYH